MAIVLLLICLLGLILFFLSIENTRSSIITSILLFSVLTLGVTEFLSLFTSLNYFNLVLSWGSIDIAIIYLIYKKESYKILSYVRIKLKKKNQKA
jgi:hypothetical protein